jgi:type IV secretory pathway VirB10-like protein
VADPVPDQAPAPAPPAGDAPLAKRVDTIEAEQQRQGGILEEIRDKLTGTAPPAVTRGDDPGPSAADMAEQMRQAVRDVNAEAAAAAPSAAPEPETTPREVMIKGKERLQRALFGGDSR